MGVMLAAAAITAAGGAYAANKASNASSKASKAQKSALDQESQVAEDQLDFGKQQYNDWKNLYYPLGQQLVAESQQTITPDYAGIHGDVQNAFQSEQQQNQRQMQRYGVNPADGNMQQANREYGMGAATAEVGARQQARAQAKDQQFNRMAQVYGLGSGQQQAANSTVNAGYSNSESAYGNAAAMYGQNAHSYNQSAAAGANMFGRGLSGVLNYFNEPKTVDTSGSAMGIQQLPSSYWNTPAMSDPVVNLGG